MGQNQSLGSVDHRREVGKVRSKYFSLKRLSMCSSQDQPQQTFPFSPNNPVLARTVAVLRLPT